jgi:hypothetical protein
MGNLTATRVLSLIAFGLFLYWVFEHGGKLAREIAEEV